MADSSFDIVSKIDRQEVDNALGPDRPRDRHPVRLQGHRGHHRVEGRPGDRDQRVGRRPRERRPRRVQGQAGQAEPESEDPRRLRAPAVGSASKIGISLKEGITSEDAKKISKLIRDEGPKGVKAQIQGDELRVSSKKRDDLQAVIALVKQQDYDFAVQFTNYR